MTDTRSPHTCKECPVCPVYIVHMYKCANQLDIKTVNDAGDDDDDDDRMTQQQIKFANLMGRMRY